MEEKKESLSYSEKRHRLIGKMIDGAKALNELFDYARRPIFFYIHKPEKYCEKLSKKYDLTKNQHEYLKIVGRRLGRAHDVVKSAKKEFGIKLDGKIKEAEGLFKAIHPGDNRSSKVIHAKAKPFWLVFYLKKESFQGDDIGLVERNNILLSLESHILDLPIQESMNEKYMFLCSKINYESHYEIVTGGIFGGIINRMLMADTEKHELKHIIDSIAIVNEHIYSDESSAGVFDDGDFERGLERDRKKMNEKMDVCNKIHSTYLERLATFISTKIKFDHLPMEDQKIVLKDLDERIRSADEERDRRNNKMIYDWLNDYEGEKEKIISNLCKYDNLRKQAKISLANLQGIEGGKISKLMSADLKNEVLSFIISTTPTTKLQKRIMLLEDYLYDQKNKPKEDLRMRSSREKEVSIKDDC